MEHPTPPQLASAPHQSFWAICLLSWRQWLLGSLVLAGFVLALGFFVIRLLNTGYNTDLPWLLETGQWILTHHRLPMTDLYSWTANGQPWVVYQWLFEIIVASLKNALGLENLIRGTIVFLLVFYVGLPLWWHRRHQTPLPLVILILIPALFALPLNISLRPMIVTSIGLGLQWVLVRSWEEGQLSFKPLCVALAVMYALWANLHTGIALGFYSLLFFGIGYVLERQGWYRFQCPLVEKATSLQSRSIWSYVLILLIALAASGLNPYGYEIFSYLWWLSSQSAMNNAISELQSMTFGSINAFSILLLWLLFVAILPERHRLFRASELIHLSIFSVMTLLVVRFIVWDVLYFLLIMPLVLWRLIVVAPNLIWFRHAILNSRLLISTALFLTIGFSVMVLAFPKHLPPVQFGTCQAIQPAINQLAKVIKPTDRLFNDSVSGSCLIQFGPKHVPVFIDTRYDFYGSPAMERELRIERMSHDWWNELQRLQIDLVLMRKTLPLETGLRRIPEAQIVFEDSKAIIFRLKS